MKILTLIIKQVFFDQIIAGTKKEETRELRPKSEKKYIAYAEDETYTAIEYQHIRFYVGYNKGRDTALVAVNGAHFEDIVDENGEYIELEDEQGRKYDMMNIVYELGDILEVNDKKQHA